VNFYVSCKNILYFKEFNFLSLIFSKKIFILFLSFLSLLVFVSEFLKLYFFILNMKRHYDGLNIKMLNYYIYIRNGARNARILVRNARDPDSTETKFFAISLV